MLAPGFSGATAWLNVDHALSLNELRGKVVVIDFWTSGCINCIQTLPVLADVEKKYAGRPVTVVGVHSAKFEEERERDRLGTIMSQYGITHPVAIDGDMKLWDAWGVQAWPTVMVLDATSHIVWRMAGEPTREAIGRAVDGALASGAKEGALSDAPLVGLRREEGPTGALAFPGKVIVLDDGSLVISDSGHNRVVFAGADAVVESVAGTGLAGANDGDFGSATFRGPQGLAAMGGTVYVADTGNHTVRAIDRRTHRVRTVAGTGEMGSSPLGTATPATSTKLRSPWGLAAADGVVYVGLAGSHQIAALKPASGTIEAFAGDGEERRLDGAGSAASFAQPSGLAVAGGALLVADSESSSIREVTIATRDVRTIVGQDLFVFGDVDGPAPRARLQHPVGVAWSPGRIWVADTYNSKVKQIDPSTGVTRTVAGGRDHVAFFEPEGLAVRGDDVYVADTKHNRIVVLSAATGATRPFELRGLSSPEAGVALPSVDAGAQPEERVFLGDVPIHSDGASVVHFDWKVPGGTGINEDAPFRVNWTSSDGLATVPTPIRGTGALVQHGFDLSVTPIGGVAGAKLDGDLSVVLCDTSSHLVCVPVRRAIEVSFRVAAAASNAASVSIPLPEAKP